MAKVQSIIKLSRFIIIAVMLIFVSVALARPIVQGPQLYNSLTQPADTQPWRIVPHPKQVTWSKQMVAVPLHGTIYTTSMKVGKLLASEVKRLRPKAVLTIKKLQAKRPVLTWTTVNDGGRDARPTGYDMTTDLRVPDYSEGYVVHITSEGAFAAAHDKAGLMDSVHTLLCVMDQVKKNNMWPKLRVRDWPTLAFRGFHITLRYTSTWIPGNNSSKKGIAIYKTMIRRLARYKFNYLIVMPQSNIALKSHPGVWDAFYSQAQIRELCAFARARGITPIPHLHTMSGFLKGKHQKEHREKIADLLEPKEPVYKSEKGERMHATKRTFKLADPDVLKFIKPVIAELYHLFGDPPYMHIGGDELSDIGNSLPPDVDRGKMLADYVNNLDDFVTKKLGARTIMWDDMLCAKKRFPMFANETHGGPPYNTADAVKWLHRDIIIMSWHYGWPIDERVPQQYPMVAYFQKKGFDVIGTTWFRQDNIVNFARQIMHDHAMGLSGTSFSIHNSYRLVTHEPMNKKGRKKAKAREELGVWASTAEGAWSPAMSADVLRTYSPYKWEIKRLRLKP